MPAVKSYAWSEPISAVVAKGETAEVLTPGFAGPENFQTDKTEAVLNSTVLRAEEFSVAWQDNFSKADVTNQTEKDWMPGDTLYLAVAGKPLDPDDVKGSFEGLEARVSANETAILDLQTRVTALEAQPGHGPPAPAPTQAPASAPTPKPAQAAHPQQRAPEPHKPAPQHRGSAKT